MSERSIQKAGRYEPRTLKKQTLVVAVLFAVSLLASLALFAFLHTTNISFTEVQATPESATKTTTVSHPTNRTTTIRETYTLRVRLDDGSEESVKVNDLSRFERGRSATFYRYSKDGALYENIDAIRSTLPGARASIYVNAVTVLFFFMTVVLLIMWQISRKKEESGRKETRV
ncbi:hypothetical protein HMPREF0620_1397 [Parascardovia denticolens DSM 10105 = JCM 12538]|uniref:DUF3592 domain-containing protein n=1 Tax=Parascardovia denticolens DSM 10105 = JCM 12538 TaxID=864564 RepID=E6K308_PARDN|nr:hypothetical protein [Parascardovia denticolens]EFG32303.2 hypothetical protein HMPREF9017_01203 [Parascardovia denticolens F0305]EFT82712.1 hypothetical protein HMPREF0620_1397 [Parascardovia denticolens DSM 10105 = JCM 12538]